MPDPTESSPDLRPGLVICAYDADEAAWDPIEDLSGQPWSPVGARTIAVAADVREALADRLSGHLRDSTCRALLLVGRTRHGADFRIQTRAENREPGGHDRIVAGAPGMARTTAPVAEMVRALNEAGLTVSASSEAEEDAGDYLLFRILNALPDGEDAPAVGLIRAPVNMDDAALTAGVKAAAGAIALHLSPLPRHRVI
jgi:pyrrolidone-carboxylate peptidase